MTPEFTRDPSRLAPNGSAPRQKLVDVPNLKEDQVLIVDVGPSEGRGKANVEILGRRLSWEPNDRVAVIV